MNVSKVFSVLICTALLGGAVPASGSAILELVDNEGHFASVSGAAPPLTLSVNNASGAFAGSPWDFAIAVGSNTSVMGIPAIDFDLTATASRSGSLTAIYSINNLTYGTGPHTVEVSSLISSLYVSGIQWNVCLDDGNVLTAQTACTGFSGITAGALSLPETTVNGMFSLTVIGRLSDATSSRLSVNAAAAVPEPQSLALFGMGLLALACMRRRKPI